MNNMLDVSDTSRTRQPSAAGWWEDRGERTTIKDKSRQQLMTCNSKNIRQHLFSCDCVTATDTPTPSISAEFEMSWRSKELSKFKVCVCTKNTYDSFSTFCPCFMIRRFEHKLYLIEPVMLEAANICKRSNSSNTKGQTRLCPISKKVTNSAYEWM